MKPSQVVEALNRFLSTVSEATLQQGGTIDEFVGDEVMAIFGAPIETPDHALAACKAALKKTDVGIAMGSGAAAAKAVAELCSLTAGSQHFREF